MLRWTVVLSVIGMSSIAQAAECYAQAHGSFCINRDTLKNDASNWCRNNYNNIYGNWWEITDSAGNVGRIGKTGAFQNAQRCESAYNNIVDSCYGHKNGGSWTADGVTLNINFCAW